MKKISLVILVICTFMFCPQFMVHANAKSINWYGYDEGMAIAKSEGKKIYLNFHADWCKYCVKMEKTTFKSGKVIDYLKENYIAIHVNADKEQNLKIKYRVSGLPSNWFIQKNGTPITQLPGYVGPDQLYNILRYINTDSYKAMSFTDFISGN